jgi:tetratricopeptide (TPR) repeat protein
VASAEQRALLERRGFDDFQRAHDHEPNEPWIYWLHAMSLRRLKRTREALRECASALDLEQPLSMWRGRRLETEKKSFFAGAVEMANQLITENPRDAEAHSVRALAYLALEVDDQAAADAASALTLNPDDSRALTVRGSVYLHRRELGRALEDFKSALGRTPQSYRAAAGRADACAALGEHANTLDSLDYAAKVANADWQRIHAHQERARLLHRLLTVGKRMS